MLLTYVFIAVTTLCVSCDGVELSCYSCDSRSHPECENMTSSSRGAYYKKCGGKEYFLTYCAHLFYVDETRGQGRSRKITIRGCKKGYFLGCKTMSQVYHKDVYIGHYCFCKTDGCNGGPGPSLTNQGGGPFFNTLLKLNPLLVLLSSFLGQQT